LIVAIAQGRVDEGLPAASAVPLRDDADEGLPAASAVPLRGVFLASALHVDFTSQSFLALQHDSPESKDTRT
jgi:hypothetical protein